MRASRATVRRRRLVAALVAAALVAGAAIDLARVGRGEDPGRPAETARPPAFRGGKMPPSVHPRRSPDALPLGNHSWSHPYLPGLRRRRLRAVSVPELLALDPPSAAQVRSGEC